MSSIKLAVYMKDEILSSLLSRAFQERHDALAARDLALGRALYDRTYTAEELKPLRKVPREFIKMQDSRRVKFANDYTTVYWGEDRPVSGDRVNTLLLTATDPLTEVYRDIKNDRQKLADEERQARAEARAKLNSATTVQRLIDLWPEIRPFAEPYLEQKKPAPLPVLQNDVLNSKFKLPVEAPAPQPAVKKKVKTVKQPPGPLAVMKRVAKKVTKGKRA